MIMIIYSIPNIALPSSCYSWHQCSPHMGITAGVKLTKTKQLHLRRMEHDSLYDRNLLYTPDTVPRIVLHLVLHNRITQLTLGPHCPSATKA